MSSTVLTLSWDSVVPVSAWIVIGTFCTLSLRRWAVTTISSTVAPVAVASAGAAGGAAPHPARIAAMAQDALYLAFTIYPPTITGKTVPTCLGGTRAPGTHADRR